MAKKKLLILCVDLDDDLGEKAKVRGPIIGRKANVEAATKFSIADPADTDGNTIFKAVRIYDDLKKEHNVEIVTVTGDRKLGYSASAKITKQLESAIDRYKPEGCVFVSDGASDEQVIPLIQSRIKINSVETLVVKQTKELEKTYFVILEKLREPQFARIVFGVPGVLLLLYFLFQSAGVRIFLGLFGAYLILKGFGAEERILQSISRSKLSLERISFIFYFAAFAFTVASIYIAISRVAALQQQEVTNIAKLTAYFIKDFLLLFPLALLSIIAGNVVEALTERKFYEIPSLAVKASAIILLWFIANNAAEWVLDTVSFAGFFYSLIFMIVAMYMVIYLAKEFKAGIIARMQLQGKEVYNEIGGFLGKVARFDKKSGTLAVQTSRGGELDFETANIASIGEKLVIKY